jgi:hypothetical protein
MFFLQVNNPIVRNVCYVKRPVSYVIEAEQLVLNALLYLLFSEFQGIAV